MSNGYDLKDIAAHYAKKSDAELIHLAAHNAAGLKPGVLEILENEIRQRNLDPSLLEGAKAQNKTYSREEINEMSQLLRQLPCPICGSKTAKLNGTVVHTVKSFILFSSFRSEPIIACPDCLDKKNQEAIVSTAVLGWWGIPWGLLKTPLYIYKNLQAKKENRSTEANGTLLGFTSANVGPITTYKEDSETLKQLINRQK